MKRRGIQLSVGDLSGTVLQRGAAEQILILEPFQQFFFTLAEKPLKRFAEFRSVAFTSINRGVNKRRIQWPCLERTISSRLFLLCIWIVIAIAPAYAQSAEPRAEPNPINEAQALILAGRTDAAIEALKAIPRSAAPNPQIDHLLGLAYYQKGDYTRAIESLSQSVKQTSETTPQYRQGVLLLGMSHYFLNQSKEAIPYLEQAALWAGNNIDTIYVLGACYAQTHQPDKARVTYSRIFGVAAESASAYLFNAQMMIRLRLEELAEKELQRALEIDSKLPQANFLLGEIAIYRADIDAGIKYLEKEIAINPAFAMAYYRLGEAYTRQVKWDEAIAPLQKSIWLNPFFSGPYIVLGKVYSKKGDLANAESILKRALRMDPNNYSGHYLLGQVLQQANRQEEAKKEFEIAERLRSESDK